MKLLPKPDGNDLRHRRAEKNEDSMAWLPEDALFDASKQLVTEPPVGAMLVAWYSRTDDGRYILKYRVWQDRPRQSVALVADLLADLTS